MGLLATLLPNQLRLARLRGALSGRYTVLPCASWTELLHACETRGVTIAVIDPHEQYAQQAVFDPMRHFKRRFPSVTVVLYAGVPPTTPRDLFELGRLGLDGLVLAEADDQPRRFQSLIEHAEARGLADTVRRSLGDAKPTVRDAVLIAVTRAHQRLSPEALARQLGVRRKVLSMRLLQSGFPSPQPLIAWGRLIVAARMLEDPERSADGVALAMDFPSGSAFRNTCQRYLQATPQQIRDRGGARFVIAAFLRGVGRVRAAGTPVPEPEAEPAATPALMAAC
jgi:AraC-like DNA-binding protein